MAGFDFEELKQKAWEAAGTIADVSVEVYKIAEEKAKTLAKTTKLNTEIAREKALIRKLYSTIGKNYYELYKNDPAEALKQDCFEITAAFGRIGEKRSELEDLKKSAAGCCDGDCCCDADFEPDDVDVGDDDD